MLFSDVQKYLISFITQEKFTPKHIFTPEDIKILELHKIRGIIDYVDREVLGHNKGSVVDSPMNHIIKLKDCESIFNFFEENNIQYAVLKGAYLDKIGYKDIGIRHSDDIDILINREDYEKVIEYFLKDGFEFGDMRDGKLNIYKRSTVLYTLMYSHQSAPLIKITEAGSIEIDLNFSICQEPNIKLTNNLLFNNTEIIDYHGILYHVLKPEFFLMQLCLHSYYDLNSIFKLIDDGVVFRLICDPYYFAKSSIGLDLQKFINIVNDCNVKKYIDYVFYYIHLLFNDSNLNYKYEKNDYNTISLSGQTEIKHWSLPFSERIYIDKSKMNIRSQLNEEDKSQIKMIYENMFDKNAVILENDL
mgnify:CR=1 FL=1